MTLHLYCAVGPTNIDAEIKFDLNKDALKRKLKSKKTMMPVDSDDIKQATSSLDDIPYLNSPTKPKATLPKLLKVVKESRRLDTGESFRKIGSKKAVKPTLSETLYSHEELVQRQQEMTCRIVEKVFSILYIFMCPSDLFPLLSKAKETATLRAIKWKEEQRARKREAKAEQEALSEELKQRFSQKAEELQQRTLLRVKELKREENEKRMLELAEREQENMARQEREALSRAEVQMERSRLLRRETEER